MKLIRTCRLCKASKLTQLGQANAWQCKENNTHIFKTLPGKVDLEADPPTFSEYYELTINTNDGHKAGERFLGPIHAREVED